MGLDIEGEKTGHHLSGGYSRLHHTTRYLALVYCAMPEKVGEGQDAFSYFMHPFIYEGQLNKDRLVEFHWSLQQSGRHFPNIMMHSDCEGNYTVDGETAPVGTGLLGGNSIELLAELELLCNDEDLVEMAVDNERLTEAIKRTILFRDLVKDEVENGSGQINFY